MLPFACSSFVAAVPIPGDTVYRSVPTGSVKHLSEIVDQPAHRRIGGMNLTYRKDLLSPIHHVSFCLMSINLADAHAILHSELGHTLTIVTVQALPHLFLIRRAHLVIRQHTVQKCIDISHRLMSVEPFDDTRLGVLVVRGEMMDALFLQQSLYG